MSVLHLKQIARRVWETFSDHVPKDDLTDKDPEREVKIRTRCLAAYAVQLVSGCASIEAGNSVIDGGDDNGLDAVYYSETQNRLILVQAKWIGDGKSEPDSGEVAKFCNGIRDLVNAEFDRFNDRLKKREDIVIDALSRFNCQISLVLIHTGADALAQHAARLVDDLLLELNDASEIATFQRFGQERIYALMVADASGGVINLDANLSFWGKIESPHFAFYGMVSGATIAAWWKAHGELLFERNLRSTLGHTDVNKQILASIDQRPEDFWYFNNGITVTAKSIEKALSGAGNRDIGSFRAVGAHVVNGAQTVSSIGRFSGDPAKLESVLVPLRMISLQDAGEGYEALITRTNNTQNRIEARDFVSQDQEQQRIRVELQMDGVEYHISRSEGYKAGAKAFDLGEATVAVACSLGDPDLAVLAKREIGRFWIDIDKAPYKRLFNPTTSAYHVYHAVLVQREIELWLYLRTQGLAKRSGKLYGVLVHGNRLLASVVFARLRLAKKLADTDFQVSTIQADLRNELDHAVNCMASMLADKFVDSFPAVVFKNPSKSKELFEACLANTSSN